MYINDFIPRTALFLPQISDHHDICKKNCFCEKANKIKTFFSEIPVLRIPASYSPITSKGDQVEKDDILVILNLYGVLAMFLKVWS